MPRRPRAAASTLPVGSPFTHTVEAPAATRLIAVCALLVAVAFVLRLPFLRTPLTADEGGYAEVARLWARGATLYGSDWVDRPQGLLLAFRGALALGAGTTADLRLLAAGAGALLGVLVFAIALRLFTVGTATVAALLATTVAASPYIEGFTLSGELLAAVLVAASVLTLLGSSARLRSPGLVLAGALAGAAWMVKQSAFDGVIAGAVVLLASRRGRTISLACFGAGAAVPIAAGVLLAADPSRWYRDVVAYGLRASITQTSWSTRAGALAGSLPALALAAGPVLLLVWLGWRSSPLVVRAWLVGAAVGVCAGGGFHQHYYLQAAPPLALAAAAGLRRVEPRSRAVIGLLAAAVVVLVAAPLWFESGVAQARRLWPADVHLQSDAAVARFVRSQTPPSASVLVVWAAADVYYLADRHPAFPYLWLRNVQTIRGALADADRILETRRPALVVEAQRPQVVHGGGATAAILARDYRAVARFGHTTILRPRRPG